MISQESQIVMERAERIYEDRLKAALEAKHQDSFVAVEPESGDYFLSDTFDGAIQAAKQRYPSRMPHIMRVGHRAALHIGGAKL